MTMRLLPFHGGMLCNNVMQKFSQTGAVQAVVTGTAVSGVAVSLLRVITKAALPDTAEGLRRSAGDSPYLPTCPRIVSAPAPSC